MPENMLVKDPSHGKPLYSSGYVRSTNIVRALMIQHGLEHHARQITAIFLHSRQQISHYNHYHTRIECTKQHAYWKNRAKMPDLYLKTKVMCQIINTDTSHNLLLGCQCVHSNLIVSYTFHQYLKYVDKYKVVKTVFTKNITSQIENYFMVQFFVETGKMTKFMMTKKLTRNEMRTQKGCLQNQDVP